MIKITELRQIADHAKERYRSLAETDISDKTAAEKQQIEKARLQAEAQWLASERMYRDVLRRL